MNEIKRIGVDPGKRVFHVTAADAKGGIVERKRLRRSGLQSYLAKPPAGCEVAMEACGSAHHWGRLASRLGHRALLTSPQFVSPYVKSNKNDANDADGIAEAACRPTMRFVGVKDVDRQCVQQDASGAAAGGEGEDGAVQPDPRLPAGVRDRRTARRGASQSRFGAAGQRLPRHHAVAPRAHLGGSRYILGYWRWRNTCWAVVV